MLTQMKEVPRENEYNDDDEKGSCQTEKRASASEPNKTSNVKTITH